MSSPIRDPNFIGGTPRSSGDVQTGEIAWTLGGGRTASVFSGNAVLSGALNAVPTGITGGGYDLQIYSGGGRLKSVMPHTISISGVNVVFYDAAVTTSGGPFPASGHKIIGFLPGNTGGAGLSGSLNFANIVYQYDMPFQSGLCAALKSGQAGFTVSWIPECSVLDNGAIVGP